MDPSRQVGVEALGKPLADLQLVRYHRVLHVGKEYLQWVGHSVWVRVQVGTAIQSVLLMRPPTIHAVSNSTLSWRMLYSISTEPLPHAQRVSLGTRQTDPNTLLITNSSSQHRMSIHKVVAQTYCL